MRKLLLLVVLIAACRHQTSAPPPPAAPPVDPELLRLPLGQRLEREAKSRPTGTPRAEEVLTALTRGGIAVEGARQVLASTVGYVFPEIRAKRERVEQVIQREEEAFNKTLDRGIDLFTQECERLGRETMLNKEATATALEVGHGAAVAPTEANGISGAFAFKLYDTYGFPLDLTQLMARERALNVDVAGFNHLMEEQKARARAARKKQVIELSQVETSTTTEFVGYEKLSIKAKLLELVSVKNNTAAILDTTPLYAEMGGQVGDTGELSHGGELWPIANTQKAGSAWLHLLEGEADGNLPEVGSELMVIVDRTRRETGARGDLLHARAVVALLREHLGRSRDETTPDLVVLDGVRLGHERKAISPRRAAG